MLILMFHKWVMDGLTQAWLGESDTTNTKLLQPLSLCYDQWETRNLTICDI